MLVIESKAGILPASTARAWRRAALRSGGIDESF
jgi:hypothetical protein